MKVNIYTRAIVHSMMFSVVVFRLIHSSSVHDGTDHPKTHIVELLLGDYSTRNLTGPTRPTGSVPRLLRVPDRTRASPVEGQQTKLSRLPDVSVDCSDTGLVLRVKRVFYGFYAGPEELTLGQNCRSNGPLEPHNDLLFIYKLTDCQSELQVLPEHVLYRNLLHYVPLSNRHFFRSLNVGVDCRVHRHHHVDSEVIRPTWHVPLRKSIRSRLGDFRIQLMDDSWSSPVRSSVYMLGQRVNVQVSTRHQYTGVKLFINSCYVTTIHNVHQTTKYSIIDNFGCLRESQINPNARFRSSRADNIVQFSFDAFQFIQAPDAQVSLHCELFVSGGDSSPAQKSCFYNHVKNRWVSVFALDSVCDCCASVCGHTTNKPLIYEGFVSTDPVTFPFSTLTSSTLDSSLLTPDDDDDIWFKVKLAKEHQRSHNHNEFVASVSVRSSDDPTKTQTESHTSTKKEEHDDEEIVMATGESFMKETRHRVDSMEPDRSLGWSEHRIRQNLVKGHRYVTERDKVPIKMSTVVKTTEESSKMNNGEPQEFILSSVIADEENLGFKSRLKSEEKSEFLVGSDDLMEQGVVRKLDLTKDPDDYLISEEI